ncbi:hypothetical protein L6452_01355 [Arctium lappa]|uniref:Uncharacterized protein n=1 Tax=Arctium lappa TaxID=4217 RepID=A0ACB9FFV7_ARCLA|nr:hypothetical protein L6452_01355 [Arctium lappa]
MMFVDAKRKRHLQVEPNISLATLSASSEAFLSISHGVIASVGMLEHMLAFCMQIQVVEGLSAICIELWDCSQDLHLEHQRSNTLWLKRHRTRTSLFSFLLFSPFQTHAILHNSPLRSYRFPSI